MSNYYIRDNQYTENQIKQLQFDDITLLTMEDKPSSLFKYFPNITNKKGKNYSIEALKNNTVHLTHPKSFDDPYDSNAFIDNSSYIINRLMYYYESCGLSYGENETYESLLEKLASKLTEQIHCGNNVEDIFGKSKNKSERANRNILIMNIKVRINEGHSDNQSIEECIINTFYNEYNDNKNTLDKFKISCFSESPYLLLMWAHYANEHKGFCIEYEIPDFGEGSKNLLGNIYPVIYTDTRNDLSPVFLNWEESGNPGTEGLCGMYKYGLLSKSIDWKYQKEWRLISLDNIIDVDEKDNCKFFKIKKVYLGHDMEPNDRKEIIQICKEKKIPYVGVTISDNAFEMKDCSVLCEDCFKMEENK